MTQPVDNQNSGIRFLDSITNFAAAKTVDKITHNKDDNFAIKAVKLTAQTVGSTLFALSGLVETTVRYALFAVAKLAQFFIPKGYTESFDRNILMPLAEQAAINTIITAGHTVNIVNNFRSEEVKENAGDAIVKSVLGVFNSKFMQGVYNIHINGFYNPEGAQQNDNEGTKKRTA